MELLAPAGELDSLKTAVQNGADAVYVGGDMFSARRSAVNFDLPALREAADYCHLRSVKLYLAVNTLIKEFELSDLCRYLEQIYQLGADAVIVQDLGVLRLIRTCLPELKIHASTQMTVTSSEGVSMLEQMGAKRVVLARELSAKEIRSIAEKTNAELEVFVHGALCMSYSGQCLMSSMIGGRSGNRGACAQPCRLPYTLLENGRECTEAKPLLSPKDLCLAERLAELADCGADSLKIEGRMKSPAYVGMVTRVYRAALDGKGNKQEIGEMLRFFSRGGSSFGYFDGKQYRDMMDYDSGAKISADRKTEKQIENSAKAEAKRIPTEMRLQATVGEPLRLFMTANGHTAEVCGEAVEKARTRPAEAERLRVQLEKLGGTPFFLADAAIEAAPDAAVSAAQVNAVRRMAADKLSHILCDSYRREKKAVVPSEPSAASEEEKFLSAQVFTWEQYLVAKEMGIREIILPYAVFMEHPEADAICAMPELPREGEKLQTKRFSRVLIQHIGQIVGTEGAERIGGHRLNVYNHETVRRLTELGISRLTVSPELNLREISQLCEVSPAALDLLIYGRLPLMTMENCVIRSAARCACQKGQFALRDRKGMEFPILTQDCRNLLLNACPIETADRLSELSALPIRGMRLYFTVESAEECRAVIARYQKAMRGELVGQASYAYTRGHFYRGVL